MKVKICGLTSAAAVERAADAGAAYLGIVLNAGWEIWAVIIGACIAAVGALGYAMSR